MNRDKIFDNNFDSPEFEMDPNFSFQVDPNHGDSRPEEDKIHYDMVARDIHNLITKSRFKKFNEIDDLGKSIKLKKAEINDVYGYIVTELVVRYSRIDIFSEMCVYFNIQPNKFYSSLSNIYKEDLIEELDKKTGVLSKKNIKKLF